MATEKYQVDDELRVIRNHEGREQLGVRRTVTAPSDALEGHIEAVRNYEEMIAGLKEMFIEKVSAQKEDLKRSLKHAEFFNAEFGKNQWGYNLSFDRVRLHYINKIDDFRKELRNLEMKEIDGLKFFAKELRDAKSELSPFKKLF